MSQWVLEENVNDKVMPALLRLSHVHSFHRPGWLPQASTPGYPLANSFGSWKRVLLMGTDMLYFTAPLKFPSDFHTTGDPYGDPFNSPVFYYPSASPYGQASDYYPLVSKNSNTVVLILALFFHHCKENSAQSTPLT